MTISYISAPEPIWYFVQLNGLPAGAGKLYTWSSLNPTTPKFAYKDAFGFEAWPSPINIDGNGTSGPFYWKLDSTNPNDLYNLIFFDLNGNLVWQIDNFPQGVSGGGGGGGTVAISLDNLVINNVFYNGDTSASPVPLNYIVCPSVNSGFKVSALTGSSLDNGFGDIRFRKDLNVATDQITIGQFTTGSDALTDDVTPKFFMNYTSNGVIGDGNKYLEIPLISDVQSLSNNNVSLSLWTNAHTSNQQITFQWYQFFGDGVGASTPVLTSFLTTADLPMSWSRTTLSTTVPTVAGKNIGPCGNTATYLRIYFPTTIAANLDITKPCVFLGPTFATAELQQYDLIESTINVYRTGTIRIGLDSYSPYGWVAMNDGTIGSASSGATTRANIDTFPLYDLIWNKVIDTYAPVTGGRGLTSIADFSANKPMQLTQTLGRALASVGIPSTGGTATNWALGQTFGDETVSLTGTQNGPHTHTYTVGPSTLSGPTHTLAGAVLSTSSFTTDSSGTGAAHENIQPTIHYNVFCKL